MGATYGEGAGPTGGYQYNKTAKDLLSNKTLLMITSFENIENVFNKYNNR